MSSGVPVEGGDLKLILVTTLKIDFLKNTRMLKKEIEYWQQDLNEQLFHGVLKSRMQREYIQFLLQK